MKRFSRRKGSIMVVTCLSMVALLGFCALAVDYGRLVSSRNQLQRACDAAALAGATELPATTTASTAWGQYYALLAARQNNVPWTQTTGTHPHTTRTHTADA